MNQKITRRVVLGTTLAALAAGPFVIRAIRRPKKDLADSFVNSEDEFEKEFTISPSDARNHFFAEWSREHQLQSVEKVEMLNASTPLLPYTRDFSGSFERKFRYLETCFLADSSQNVETMDMDITPSDLISYWILEGELYCDEGNLCINTNRNTTKYLEIDVAESRSNGIHIVEKEDNEKATVLSIDIDLNRAEFNERDEKSIEIKTGLAEKETASQGATGQIVFNEDFIVSPETVEKIKADLMFPLLYAKVRSLLFVPLPSSDIQMGSSVDFHMRALLSQQFPHISYRVARTILLNKFSAVQVSPQRAHDEKIFRNAVLRAAHTAYKKGKLNTSVDMSESTFFDLVEKQTVDLCKAFQNDFINKPCLLESWFVDSMTGLIICSEGLFTQKYQKLGNCFESKSFQVF